MSRQRGIIPKARMEEQAVILILSRRRADGTGRSTPALLGDAVLSLCSSRQSQGQFFDFQSAVNLNFVLLPGVRSTSYPVRPVLAGFSCVLLKITLGRTLAQNFRG